MVSRILVNIFMILKLFQMTGGRSEDNLKKMLLNKKAELMSKLRLSPSFWALLVKYKVLLQFQAEDIKVSWQVGCTKDIWLGCMCDYAGVDTGFR